ncbi:MAG: hypothetical protein QGI83_10725 [Candidatus Latescibacteria bacterium]|nr:hypothetical protein [Candidatus Latescibacterota bacterium]
MARPRSKPRSRDRARGARRAQTGTPQVPRKLPYTRRNWIVFAAGIGTILIGYVCLSRPPVDGFMSLTLAPILLVLGYCVLIPIALLLGPGQADQDEKGAEQPGQNVGG